MLHTLKVLDHGVVKLRNLAGPTRRVWADGALGGSGNLVSGEELRPFDADDIDPAQAARKYAEAIVELLRPHLPGLMGLFDKHCRKPE